MNIFPARAIVAGVLLLLCCADAQAQLRRSTDGTGNLVIVPYFIASGQVRTEFEVRNAGPAAIYAMRFEDSRLNVPIATTAVDPNEPFTSLGGGPNYGATILYLGANATARYEIRDNGAQRIIRLLSSSGSFCTVPKITAAGRVLEHFAIYEPNEGPTVFGTNGREVEGTILFIPEGSVTQALLQSQIDANDCNAINARWDIGGSFANGTDQASAAGSPNALRLVVSTTVLHPLWDAVVPATMIHSFYDTGSAVDDLHFGPGFSLPSLNNARAGSITTPVVTSVGSYGSGAEAVAAVITIGPSYFDNYSVALDAASNSVADVLIVSQPTKKFFVRGPVNTSLANSRVPYSENVDYFNPTGSYAGEPVLACLLAPLPANRCTIGSPRLVSQLRLRSAVTALRLTATGASSPAPFPVINPDAFVAALTPPSTGSGPATAMAVDYAPFDGRVGSAPRRLVPTSGTSPEGLPAITFLLRRRFGIATPLPFPKPQPIPNTTGQAGDSTGFAVANSPDFVIVAAPTSPSASGTGAVYVYANDGMKRSAVSPKTQRLLATLRMGGTINGDKFGTSVVISNDGQTIVVGAPGKNGGAGAAAVFRKPVSGWTDTNVAASTISPSPSPGDVVRGFGDALAMGPRAELVVGAPQSDIDGIPQAGYAAAYRLDAGSYTVVFGIPSPDPQANAKFGTGLAIDATRMIIGAPEFDGSGAYYDYRVAVAQSQSKGIASLPAVPPTLSPGGKASRAIGDKFASSIDLDRGVMVIGAPGDDGNGPESGRVYLYEDDGTPQHRYEGPIAPGQPGDEVGTRVSVHNDFILLGAPGATRANRPQSGAVFAIERNEAGWFEDAAGPTPQPFARTTEIPPAVGQSGQRFGAALYFGTAGLVVGAPNRNVQTSDSVNVAQGEAEAGGFDRILRSGFE